MGIVTFAQKSLEITVPFPEFCSALFTFNYFKKKIFYFRGGYIYGSGSGEGKHFAGRIHTFLLVSDIFLYFCTF